MSFLHLETEAFLNQMIEQTLEQANKLIFVKHYDEAAEILKCLCDENAGDPILLVHLRRIELATKLNTLRALGEEYDQRAAAKPDDLDLKICLLLIAQHEDKLTSDQVIEQYQTFLKSNPEHPAIYFGIGFALEMEGNIDRAIFNYQKSIELDSTWFPNYFGLSQLHYQKGDSKSGDHYFYLFENSAPYNVYGNFDTHRRLSRDFLDSEKFEDAAAAIETLGEWWIDNKGYCPAEIELYENLAIRQIYSVMGSVEKEKQRENRVHNVCESLLKDPKVEENVMYFSAKTLEEFNEFELALRFYKKVLRIAGNNPAMIQKIGSQFLSMGEYNLAKELFEDAYEVHPDNPEIRFCILVSKLKLAEVNVEEYLIGKERLKQLIANESDKVEVLSILHSLLAKFREDPEVHFHIGDAYLKMGNRDRAAEHYRKMFELDSLSKLASIRYVSFLMHHESIDEASEILDRVSARKDLDAQDLIEINWLKATYHSGKGEFEKSQDYLKRICQADPWNVSYLVQYVINLTHLSPVDAENRVVDDSILKLANLDEAKLDWEKFDDQTQNFEDLMLFELAYVRRKIRFLYADGDRSTLDVLVKTVCDYDAAKGTYDFIKLLNTNFDSPYLYWSLGLMYKELWQLDVAKMWFEQTMFHSDVNEEIRANCYLEIADCNIWLGKDLPKAIEFTKIAMDMQRQNEPRALNILSHAYLKSGLIKQAHAYLSRTLDPNNPEVLYLNGLMEYRNGAKKKANEIWKPLLTAKSDNIRVHNIKQEVLKYYFDGEPYLKVN